MCGRYVYTRLVPCVSQALNVFRCTQFYEGSSYQFLSADPAILCFEKRHWRLVVLNAVAIFTYRVLIPAGLAYQLLFHGSLAIRVSDNNYKALYGYACAHARRHVRSRIHTRSRGQLGRYGGMQVSRHTHRWLYSRFEPRFYWWHLTVIVRQFWIISISQFAEHMNPVVQLPINMSIDFVPINVSMNIYRYKHVCRYETQCRVAL